MRFRILSCCLTAVVIALSAPDPARATGPFLDLPSYFGPIDTSGVTLDLGQSLVKGENANSGLFAFGIGLRGGDRAHVRMKILYPVIQQDRGYDHGFADLLLSGRIRIVGDSLGVNGLFLRGDMRIPTGSAILWPYSGESMDGGGGLEARKISQSTDLRCALTYILSGRRIEEPGMRMENYALAALLAGARPFRQVSVDLSVFAQFFRNGDYREVYILSARVHMKGGIDIGLSGGVDSGESLDRVWNSMVQLALTWRFPGGGEEEGPAPGDIPPGDPSPGDLPPGMQNP